MKDLSAKEGGAHFRYKDVYDVVVDRVDQYHTYLVRSEDLHHSIKSKTLKQRALFHKIDAAIELFES